jgi:hypothetical protein
MIQPFLRLRYIIPVWILVYLWECYAFPEPDRCPDGSTPSDWCGCEPPILGNDC